MTKASLGMEAASAARKKLIDLHKTEYEGFLKTERVARGLPELPNMKDPEAAARRKTERLTKRREKLEAQLRELNAQINGDS